MADSKTQNLTGLHFRAKLPRYVGYSAIAALFVAALIVTVGFFRERNRVSFHLKSEHTQLSKDVVAEVNGYERLETEGDRPKYYIKADRATTFSDNHQEMENVYFQIYDDAGNAADKMTAAKALYVPEENKNFTAYLAGSVNIETRDALKVHTEQITYTKSNDRAEATEQVEFERENVRGKALGALVHIAEKKLELLKDVDIYIFESAELAKSNIHQANIKSGSAVFDQAKQRIELHDNVVANIVTSAQAASIARTIDVTSDRAEVILDKAGGTNPVLKQLELFDDVNIQSVENGGKPTKIESGYALYDKPADKFDLKNGVHILTIEDEKPTNIRANAAVYEQLSGGINLSGAAEITQASDVIRGDNIAAQLYPNKKLKHAAAIGNAFLGQTANDRTSELSANELNASFNENQELQIANSVGESAATMTPSGTADYTKITLSAPRAIHMWFKGEGVYDRMQTDGRTTIQLSVPDNATDAANKRVTADAVRTFFDAEGKNLQKAEAIGNAELFVEPLHSSSENYKTTVNAPRFDCDFFPGSNDARSCVAGVKAKAVRVPTAPDDSHGTQTITADKLTAAFNARTKDVERMDAIGGAKFSELDRNAISSQFGFTASDRTVRLRGSEPTVWDSKARARAKEIDWDTKNQKSFLRGGVSTTYYSQNQTGGATPFSDSKKPVFLTADSAEMDHKQETGRYTGHARGWQETNYVRAETFLIDQHNGTFQAEGNVQSLLYNAKRKENGKETTVPIYAAAKKMQYWRNNRLLRYEDDVDVRQGNDRIVSGLASVYLSENNEVSQTIAENNVVITQPDRRATGDFAQYNVAEDTVMLRGNPATVDDRENGSSQGGQITVNMRDNRVTSEGKSKQNTAGRIRSVYKVKNE
jgi:LPS export ABC transporter protein LptC/lipopolysaccharide transport protein LptA